jgi:putative Mg2+ transporter-C (MgtC) family protein
MDLSTFALRVFIAFSLGIAIGLERQWRQRMAGLRTNALVAVGAALFSSISILMDATANPTQVAAYVVSGVGFLAGAVIFREGFSVRGLNTAATMWATAAVGTLCGSGFLAEAAFGAVIVLSANVVLRPIGARINRQTFAQSELTRGFEISVTTLEQNEEHIRSKVLATISQTNIVLHELESRDLDAGRVEIVAHVVSQSNEPIEKSVGMLSLDPLVLAAGWTAGEAMDEESGEAL